MFPSPTLALETVPSVIRPITKPLDLSKRNQKYLNRNILYSNSRISTAVSEAGLETYIFSGRFAISHYIIQNQLTAVYRTAWRSRAGLLSPRVLPERIIYVFFYAGYLELAMGNLWPDTICQMNLRMTSMTESCR